MTKASCCRKTSRPENGNRLAVTQKQQASTITIQTCGICGSCCFPLRKKLGGENIQLESLQTENLANSLHMCEACWPHKAASPLSICISHRNNLSIRSGQFCFCVSNYQKRSLAQFVWSQWYSINIPDEQFLVRLMGSKSAIFACDV